MSDIDTAVISKEQLRLINKIVKAAQKYMGKCNDDQWCPDGAEDLWFAVEAFNKHEEGN